MVHASVERTLIMEKGVTSVTLDKVGTIVEQTDLRLS